VLNALFMRFLAELNAGLSMLANMILQTTQPDHHTRNGLVMTMTLLILLVALALLVKM
jgi:hypothetical protein